MSGARSPEPEYVAARRVLLDAFEALGKHRKAIALVGAQAIYLHVGDGDLAAGEQLVRFKTVRCSVEAVDRRRTMIASLDGLTIFRSLRPNLHHTSPLGHRTTLEKVSNTKISCEPPF